MLFNGKKHRMGENIQNEIHVFFLSKGGREGLPQWLRDKESTCQCRIHRFNPWVRKIPWREKCQPTPSFLPGKSHGQKSLVGYSLWGHKELDRIDSHLSADGHKLIFFL